ncbi:hypothetical protein G2W53_039316 [Senna tora]|uniref:Uncharacterized protein n=1 Tax=Senna tora TaxID=362788 RepID=A0A834W2Q9_9FABA|nr:hypothetical protein G2W53_039316 [Senna tora]
MERKSCCSSSCGFTNTTPKKEPKVEPIIPKKEASHVDVKPKIHEVKKEDQKLSDVKPKIEVKKEEEKVVVSVKKEKESVKANVGCGGSHTPSIHGAAHAPSIHGAAAVMYYPPPLSSLFTYRRRYDLQRKVVTLRSTSVLISTLKSPTTISRSDAQIAESHQSTLFLLLLSLPSPRHDDANLMMVKKHIPMTEVKKDDDDEEAESDDAVLMMVKK